MEKTRGRRSKNKVDGGELRRAKGRRRSKAKTGQWHDVDERMDAERTSVHSSTQEQRGFRKWPHRQRNRCTCVSSQRRTAFHERPRSQSAVFWQLQYSPDASNSDAKSHLIKSIHVLRQKICSSSHYTPPPPPPRATNNNKIVAFLSMSLT